MYSIQSFCNNFVTRVTIFGVDNSLTSHNNKGKNNAFVVGERPPDDITGSTGAATKMFNINVSNLFVNGK